MAKSIARLADELANAKAAGDADGVVRIRAEAHNHPSTVAARRRISGADSNTRHDVKQGRRARA